MEISQFDYDHDVFDSRHIQWVTWIKLYGVYIFTLLPNVFLNILKVLFTRLVQSCQQLSNIADSIAPSSAGIVMHK